MPIKIVTWLKNKQEAKALFEEGWAFESINEPMEAVNCYAQGHEIGHTLSTFLLGIYIHQGELIEKNYPLAEQYISQSQADGISFLEECVRKNEAVAQYYFGYLLISGLGVEKDLKKGIELYRKSAKQGNAMAQNGLGWVFENGLDVEQNNTEACAWYRKSAEQGYSIAQFKLGCMHQHGRGVRQDHREAFKWCQKAGEQGHVYAQFNLGLMYEHGQGVKRSDRDAYLWYLKAANREYVLAQCKLGSMCERGQGVERNDRESFNWYFKSAEQGYAVAQLALGLCYDSGRGVNQDDEAAFDWYLKAAKQGIAAAQFNLGVSYANGRGVNQSDTEAFNWYLKSAEKGEVRAQYNLGAMYLEGRGVKQDSKNAFKWIRKAADCNLTIAFYYLGKLFENGTGVDKDEAQALRWYHKAASQNYPGATAKIANLESKLSARKEKQIPMAQPSADSPSKVVESFFYKSKKLSDSPVSYASSFVSLNSSEPLEKPSSKSSSPLLNAGRMEINLEILPEDLKLGKAISSGGFGTVYKGYHHGRKVAIKQLHAREMTENALLEFQREATIMMRLHSPSVVTLYGVTLNSPYYLVMEYMNGGSLYHLLQSNQDLNWKSRAKMALEIGQGLSFLHSRNILHRDLKSMNVLLDKLHRVKLGDFGLARVKQESSSQNTQRSMGTTSWMAPELFKRRAEYTKACDVYSLGMLLWELASRQIPFADAPDPGVIMTWVMQGNREAIPVGTPVWYSLLIQACWDAEPTKRPEIAEVVQQLEKGFAEEKAKAAGSVPQTAQPTPSTATSRLPGYLSNSQTSVPSYLSGVQGVQSNIENLYLSSAPVSTSGASYRALASGNASYLNLFGAHVTQGANSSFTNEAVSQTPPSP